MGISVGIIGVGVCGGSLKEYFDQCTDHKIFLHDPPKGLNDDLSKCDAVFICVPVPTVDGKQNLSIVNYALNVAPPHADVFLRSTVLPGTADHYGIWSMPEFLTERTAVDDIFKQDIITGCTNTKLLDDLFPDKNVLVLSNSECELTKFAHNCFGAVKVNFFNIIYDICERLGLNYENVREGCLMTGYINEVHTKVPGPDGQLGWGGKCFPPNMQAFNGLFKYDSIKACIEENYQFRHGKHIMKSQRFDRPMSKTQN